MAQKTGDDGAKLEERKGWRRFRGLGSVFSRSRGWKALLEYKNIIRTQFIINNRIYPSANLAVIKSRTLSLTNELRKLFLARFSISCFIFICTTTWPLTSLTSFNPLSLSLSPSLHPMHPSIQFLIPTSKTHASRNAPSHLNSKSRNSKALFPLQHQSHEKATECKKHAKQRYQTTLLKVATVFTARSLGH